MISAPIRDKGSITRAIGRLDSDASPVKATVIAWLATSPISRRVEVPELPMSSADSGCSKPPTPTPWTIHAPLSSREMSAPIALIAAAVASTSSPSSKPVIRLSPTASAESISARWLIDLSPGTVTVPRRAPRRTIVISWGSAWGIARGLLTVRLRYGKARSNLQARTCNFPQFERHEAHRW